MADSPLLSTRFPQLGPGIFNPDYFRLLFAVARYCHPGNRYKRWRLIFYGLLSPRLTYMWFRRLVKSPLLQEVVEQRKDLVERLHRRILRQDYDIARRWQLLSGHYDYLETVVPAEVLRQVLLGQGLRLARITASGEDFELILSHSGRHVREGELALYWIHVTNISFLVQMSFTLVQRPQGLGIYVGGLQGHGSNTREMVTQACKWCSGLTPRGAVAEGLLAFARHVRADFVLGVADAQHIAREKKNKFFRYDAFWEELGGQINADGDFQLSLHSTHKPLAEVEVRRRAQYRRRRAHLEEIAQRTLESLKVYWPMEPRPVNEVLSGAEAIEPLLIEAE